MKMKFYEKTWFIILMAIFVPPVALGILIFKKKDMNKIIKFIISGFLVFWSLIWIIALFVPAEGEQDAAPTTTQATQATSTSISIDNTHLPTETTTEEISTEENTTLEEEETKNTTTPTTKSENDLKKPTKPTTTKSQTSTKPATTKAPTTKVPTTKPVETTKQNTENSRTVYRTKSGDCYHYKNPCGNGIYYEVSLTDAKESNLRPCEKCVLN